MRKVMMSRPHLTKKQARTCKSVQKIIKTRFFVDNHEILLYFSFIDIISSSERLAAGKESGLNEQVERRQLSKYIEGGIAYLAAQQRTDGELAILESILGKLKAAIQAGDILSIFEYDRAFHDDLARAAHNPILFACLQTIEEINEACVKRYDKFLIMLDDCYNEHFQIFTAVANQQPEKAQAAMAQHARSSKKILL